MSHSPPEQPVILMMYCRFIRFVSLCTVRVLLARVRSVFSLAERMLSVFKYLYGAHYWRNEIRHEMNTLRATFPRTLPNTAEHCPAC